MSTATRVGMGNLVGVVAAISAGGAGAVFWMWITALLGSSTAFVEATLAQLHKQEDPLYGGYRGGPAYYIHHFCRRRQRRKDPPLSAAGGALCHLRPDLLVRHQPGYQQLRIHRPFNNAFQIPPCNHAAAGAAGGSDRTAEKRHGQGAGCDGADYGGLLFLITVVIILLNIDQLPSVFQRIFSEAFGLRQVVAGGFGAVLMNGVKRGLFSNEAGSGSAPCAAAAADVDHPAKAGLLQALGVFIDTIVICSCTAFIILLVPPGAYAGLEGMDLLQAAMQFHLGQFGVMFIAVDLWLFSFSTFIGMLFYARSNVAYLFGDNWISQTRIRCWLW